MTIHLLTFIVVATALVSFFVEIPYRSRWHFRFEGTNLLAVATPWFFVVLSHDGFDPASYQRWTGIYLGWGCIKEAKRGDPHYHNTFRHELRSRYVYDQSDE